MKPVLIRALIDGTLDTTSGTVGVTSHQVLAAVTEFYGKVNKDNVQAMVVLLSKNGAPETGFSTNGRIRTDLGGNGDSRHGMALSTDSKTAYLAGYSNVSADEVMSDDSFLGRLKVS